MKILFKGNVFNPTGFATANREIVKALVKEGCQVQCSDTWHDGYDFNAGLEFLNSSIGVNKNDTVTIFADYPQHWRDGYGKIVGHFLHEGTKLHPGWTEMLNQVDKIFVPSKATKNLFNYNGVTLPKIEVIPYGVNELYVPKQIEKKEDDAFVFLSVNSWTGQMNDRKGTDLLIKAFDEEFSGNDNVKLLLKISTFWDPKPEQYYRDAINLILGHENENIMINTVYVPEENLVSYYQMADCFVSPTRSEAFGLTILNAMACGLPVIVTKDNNSGYMDFCKGKDSVLFIKADKMEQADMRFFAKGNLQPIPELDSLKEQMKIAYNESRGVTISRLKENALKNSEQIRKDYTWQNTAKKIMEFIK
jgi:glycosyltransferase involved in cell wall biosynthesis